MYLLENIANRPIPVPGTDLKPLAGERFKVEDLNPEIQRFIQNKFFRVIEEEIPALKEIESPKEQVDESQEIEPEEELKPESSQKDYSETRKGTKARKYNKKKKKYS